MVAAAVVGVPGDCKFILDLWSTGGEAQHPASSCCKRRKAQQSYACESTEINFGLREL